MTVSTYGTPGISYANFQRFTMPTNLNKRLPHRVLALQKSIQMVEGAKSKIQTARHYLKRIENRLNDPTSTSGRVKEVDAIHREYSTLCNVINDLGACVDQLEKL